MKVNLVFTFLSLFLSFAFLTSIPLVSYADTSSGMIAHYTFDEGSGTTAADTAGSNTGTLMNGPTWAGGGSAKIGNGALQLDGVDDMVKVGSSDFIGTSDITATAWIKPNGFGGLSAGAIIDNGSFIFRIRNAYIEYRGDGSAASESADNSISLNQWQFVAVTRVGRTVNFYINGVLSGTANQTNDVPTTGRSVYVGNRAAGDTGFNGSIDDVRIYNRALTTQDVTDLFALGNGGGGGATTYSLTVTNGGNGTVSSNPSGITCPGTCSVSGITAGTPYTLIATPNSNYTTSWSGCTSSTGNTCSVTVNSDTSVTATFTANAAPDTTAPTASITAPSNAASVSGSVTVTASASDNVGGSGVAGVQFKLDGANLQTEDTSSPYTIVWDSTASANGAHTLVAVTRDTAGNIATSSSISVTISNQAQGGTNQVDLLDSSGNFIHTYIGTGTIQKCADVATAGQTCLIYPGTYNERVTPANSGTASNVITYRSLTGTCAPGGTCPKVRAFTVSGKNYTTIKGLEFTDSGMTSDGFASVWLTGNISHASFINNYVHDTSAACVRVDLATFPIIRGNTIKYCGTPVYAGGGAIGILATTPVTDMLIENNAISYVSDFVNSAGNRWVYRNNTLGPSDPLNAIHIDGIQANDITTNVLDEGNLSIDNNSSDNHFFLNQMVGSDHWIVRYNSTCRSNGITDERNANQLYFYNNTFYANTNTSSGNSQIEPISSTGNVALNNIWYASTKSTTPIYGGTLVTRDYDLWYLDPDPNETHAVHADPLVANAASCDYNLQSTSPAIDHGGPLARVSVSDSGSGTNLIVDNAGFFQDGWAGVNPDWIAVGTTGNIAQISSINYTNNTIILSAPLFRSAGQSVFLFKNSSGVQVLYGSAPDVGAYEYNSGGVTSSPSDTTAPSVSITAPLSGTTVSGSIPLSSSASDNVGVAGVQFRLDGVSLGTELVNAPYSGTWDTSGVVNGSHILTASARDAANNTTISNPVTITVSNTVTPPSDTTAPTIPTGLTATPANATQVNLVWVASTDASGIASYKIYRNNVLVATVTGTSYSDTGLTEQTTYSYKISAVDASSNANTSVQSGAVSATTPAAPPPPVPPVLSAGSPTSALTAGTIRVTLSLSTDKAAVCKYSTAANTTYAAMTNTFTTTGGTTHSTSISNLTDGSTYTYYIRCAAQQTLINTGDYIVSFSVSSPAVVTTTTGSGGTTSGGTTSSGSSYSSTGTFTPTVPQPTPANGTACIPTTIPSTLAPLPIGTTNLTIGTRSAAVTTLQTFLVSKGYLTRDSITGYYGPLTNAAVVKYKAALLPRTVACPTTPAAGATGSSRLVKGFQFTATLIPFATNPQVKSMQIFLNDHGYTVATTGSGSKGNETTYFGNATKAALIKFQKANNISPAIGNWGPLTRAKVNSLLK